MTTTKSNIPTLRFNNEQGNYYPDWKRKPIGKIGEIIGGGTPATNQKRFWNGNINWFTPSEIKSKYSNSSIRKISEQGLAQSSAKLLPVGTILFTSRATIGEVSIAMEECTTNQGFQSFVVNSSSYSNEYTYYWIVKNKKLFLRIANGSTYLEVTNSEVKKILFDTPNLKEQQKIASFLSSVDTKIEQLGKKKALLEQYKKGMMQKLFSQEIRFKDEQGKDYPDWEEVRASQIFTSHTNKKHNSDLPILAATQDRGVIPRNETGLEIQSSARSIASYKVIEPGDFVISLRSFQGGIEYSEYHGIGSPAYTVLKPIVEIISNFFRFYFKKKDFISRLNNTIIGIRDGKQIPYSDFAAMKLCVPSLKEQQKIAAFLSSIDKKIELVTEQLKQARIFKKGLFQQMFI